MPEFAANLPKLLASETDITVNIRDKSSLKDIVSSMSDNMVAGLDDLTDALTDASAAVIAAGFTLFAIKFVPRWAMGLFKAIH